MKAVTNRMLAPACALTLPLCVLAMWPVVELGICDEWSTVKTVQVLARTGHIVYNGWEAAILGWQLYLGAAFVKLFGFSFTTVRLSILPVAMATALLSHRVFVRCGLSERNATLGTLALALSPLFLPLAVSFMTDVPGLFSLILCLYACLRALEAETDKSALAWICFAAASNAMLGTVRQIAWLGVLIMVPSTLWLLRRRLRSLTIGATVYLASISIIYVALRWFHSQPYSVPEPLIQGALTPKAIFRGGWVLLASIPELAFLLLPVLLFFVPAVPFRNRRAVALLALCSVLVTVYLLLAAHRDEPWLVPYLPSYIRVNGMMPEDIPHGVLPVFLSLGVRLAVTGLAALAGISFVTVVLLRTNGPHSSDSESVRHVSWRDLAVLLLPLTLAYYLLLLPRAFFSTMDNPKIYDRYILPLLFIALIAVLRCYQEKVRPRLPAAALLPISLYAICAVAGAHDTFAQRRAFATAIQELRAAGIPRVAIDGGWEFNGWNQIELNRFVNDPKIPTLPGDRFRPPVITKFGKCRPPFLNEFSAVWPRYSLATGPTDCLGDAGFQPVQYRTWLAPRLNTLYIVKIGLPRYVDRQIASGR